MPEEAAILKFRWRIERHQLTVELLATIIAPCLRPEIATSKGIQTALLDCVGKPWSGGVNHA